MRIRSILNKKGVTLIELLVVMVIAAITMAGIYRVFIGQTKTYAIQDQVMEVQQSVRGAMEIMLRDLRMTGFDDDRTNTSEYPDKTVNPKIVTVPSPPIVIPVKDPSDDITVDYEYFDRNVNPGQQWHTVRFWRDAGTSRLMRRLTVDGAPRLDEIILENVNGLEFTYGVDVNVDGIMDDQNGNGQIDNNDWLKAAGVGTLKVVAIRVTLTGRSDQTNIDVAKVISPRTLTSVVTLRNMSLR